MAPCGKRSGCAACAASSAAWRTMRTCVDASEEDVGGREERKVGVVVLVVVPAEEWREPAARVELAGEATGVVGLVLQGLELRTR